MFDGVIEVSDGRKLGYSEYGSKGGYPVLLFHGTPGSRFQTFAHLVTRESQAFRIIVPERPGYGLSDVQHERTLSHHVADVQTLVTHLGVERFSVVGISGGAPYALACARALPEQVERVALLCGVGPFSQPELLAECAELEQALVHKSEVGAQYVVQMVAAAQNYPDAAVQHIFESLPLTDQSLIGKAMLSVFRDMLVEAMRIPDGMVDDYEVLAKPWDFSLAEVQAPVHLWHSTNDDMVGIRHAEYLTAQLPNAVLHTLLNTGHLATPFACAPHVTEYLQATSTVKRI